MEEILKQIEKNTRHKWSTRIIVSANKTSFNTTFNPPLELDKNKHYEIALTNLETYYSFPNINKENNMFEYYDGKTWKKVIIPEGAYELKYINSIIQKLIGGDFVTIQPNKQTLKSIMTIKPNYKVSFKEKNTLANLLGFTGEEYGTGTHESENIVNILIVNSILVHLNIINGSIVNGQTNPVIYNFFPNVSPGRKIVEKPAQPIYLPVHSDTIKDLKVTITDQNNNLLNLRGESITITFHVREI
jgi:hypothetical protein